MSKNGVALIDADGVVLVVVVFDDDDALLQSLLFKLTMYILPLCIATNNLSS